jgi:hypothetical protein
MTEETDSGGKAVPAPSDVGVRTTVLMPGHDFRRLLAEATRNGDRLTDWARMARYALRHELGHAKDFRLRGITEQPKIDKNGPFRVAEIERQELTNVLQEFFACAHSGRSLTQEDFRLIVANEYRITQHFRRGLRDNFWAYLDGGYEVPNTLRAFKYDMALGYWSLLASYAKITGCMIANGGLRILGPIWEGPGPEAGVFARLHDLLRLQWGSYPRLDEGVNRDIIRCWLELMQIDGAMSLEVSGDEDALVKQVNEALEREWGQRLPRTMRF